jgi:hypothetical protein
LVVPKVPMFHHLAHSKKAADVFGHPEFA